jgi:hypothetical protein
MTLPERLLVLIAGIGGVVYVIRQEIHGPTLFGKNGKKAAVSTIVAIISLSALTLVFGESVLVFVAGAAFGFFLRIASSFGNRNGGT